MCIRVCVLLIELARLCITFRTLGSVSSPDTIQSANLKTHTHAHAHTPPTGVCTYLLPYSEVAGGLHGDAMKMHGGQHNGTHKQFHMHERGRMQHLGVYTQRTPPGSPSASGPSDILCTEGPPPSGIDCSGSGVYGVDRSSGAHEPISRS